MEKQISAKGYVRYVFEDSSKNKCILIESKTLIEPAILLGIENPKVLLDLKTVDSEMKGVVKYPLPDGVTIESNMELNVEQVKALIPLLQYFVDNAELPREDDIEKGE